MNNVLIKLGKITYLATYLMGSGLSAMDVLERKSKIDLNERFIEAAQEGNQQLVELCIAEGADLNAIESGETTFGETALIKAARRGHIEICKLLVGKGADVNAAKDKSDATALMIAVLRSRYEICKLLVDAGAHVNVETKEGGTPFSMVFWSNNKSGKGANILNLLIDHGVHIHAKNKDGATGLIEAAYGLNYGLCKILIEKGIDVNAQDNEGKTALMNATRYITGVDIQRICELLIASGANVYLQANNGTTAFGLAANAGNEQTCQLLIKVMTAHEKQQKRTVPIVLYSLLRKDWRTKELARQIVMQLKKEQKKECRNMSVNEEISKVKDLKLWGRLMGYLNKVK
jgi:ankyrin repeat protein